METHLQNCYRKDNPESGIRGHHRRYILPPSLTRAVPRMEDKEGEETTQGVGGGRSAVLQRGSGWLHQP